MSFASLLQSWHEGKYNRPNVQHGEMLVCRYNQRKQFTQKSWVEAMSANFSVVMIPFYCTMSPASKTWHGLRTYLMNIYYDAAPADHLAIWATWLGHNFHSFCVNHCSMAWVGQVNVTSYPIWCQYIHVSHASFVGRPASRGWIGRKMAPLC